MTDRIVTEFDCAVAYDAGAQQERAAIVKWLREKKIDWCRCEDYIEAGEHLK